MEAIMNNWVLMIAAIAVCVYAGVGVYAFMNRPRSEQIDDVREWLIFAVKLAEDNLDGPGELKLRWVYDLFIDKFPVAARFIGFQAFSEMVDEALDKMKELLKDGESNADCH